ncbi:MAG TPA: SsrA-binding protein, partial [Acidimicrobiia bacterium]|nr:SsrA-binding protein [Acidimicrobiia bacterium]
MSRRGDQVAITNRKARHDYFVLDSFECGVMLKGAEVKSIRNGRANLQDAFARVEDGEVWLYGMHISPYEFSRGELDPVRRRKLLLHRREIATIERATEE